MAKAKALKKADLTVAEEGSWYTIIGAGGDPQEWVDGVEELLAEAGIGKPVAWFEATGEEVNAHIRPSRPDDTFDPGLLFLFFPLDGLDVGKLAMFKLRMQDRWFDDVVQNSRDAS